MSSRPIPRRCLLAMPFFLASAAGQDTQDDWQSVGRIVAVGDVHGDKDALSATLKKAGLIDDRERWTGGAAHLVQIGDIPARGPQTRKAFDLLMRLEAEAASAGGRVHALIGNHDAGVIYGDLRNILPEEYGEFRTRQSDATLANAWEDDLATERRAGRLSRDLAEMQQRKTAWFESHPPGFAEHRAAFRPSGQYGSWIRRNNAVIRINDTLFVHGGISPKYATKPRAELNATIRRELSDPDRLLPGTTTDVQSPLWYRGFAEGEPATVESHLETVLRFHQVRRIVIGHTVTRTAIMPRFDGRVVNIDLGLSRFYGRPPACLVLEGKSGRVLHRNAAIPLPNPGVAELLKYLRAVAAADEPPSPVTALLKDLESRQ